MGKRLEINIGDKFGMLTVIKETESKRIPSGQINRFMLCRCDCGTEKEIRLLHLVRFRIISCGCAYGIVRHGDSNKKIYKLWRSIKYRCNTSPYITTYYSNHITICSDWDNDYILFRDWALSNGYKEGLQIDRKDNTKGYYPDNCRFVTSIINVNNRENTFMVEYNGKITPFMNIVYEKELFMNIGAIRGRIKRGWSVQKAIDTPIKTGNYIRVYKTKSESYDNLMTINNERKTKSKPKRIV